MRFFEYNGYSYEATVHEVGCTSKHLFEVMESAFGLEFELLSG